MKILQENNIENDVVSVHLSVSELGTSTLDADAEKNQLSNFIKTIEYSKIDFKANMKINNGVPIITEDEVDNTTVESVEITDLINKQHTINEKLDITFTIDTNKIPDSDLSTVFNTKEILGQARIVLFAEKVKSTISEKLNEIRSLSNTFEGDATVVL